VEGRKEQRDKDLVMPMITDVSITRFMPMSGTYQLKRVRRTGINPAALGLMSGEGVH